MQVFWVLRLGMGERMVVAAYDDELLGYLRERRIPAYNCACAQRARAATPHDHCAADPVA